MQGKKENTRSPFDISGPSQIGAELERARIVSERNRGSEDKKAPWRGWIIGKSDPNERFTAINAAQFGTRQRRKSK